MQLTLLKNTQNPNNYHSPKYVIQPHQTPLVIPTHHPLDSTTLQIPPPDHQKPKPPLHSKHHTLYQNPQKQQTSNHIEHKIYQITYPEPTHDSKHKKDEKQSFSRVLIWEDLVCV